MKKRNVFKRLRRLLALIVGYFSIIGSIYLCIISAPALAFSYAEEIMRWENTFLIFLTSLFVVASGFVLFWPIKEK